MPGVIDFVYNWNNKLDCDAFTTIRLRNDNKYRAGNEFYVNLKEHNRNINKGLCKCVDIRHFKISLLNPYISYLDMGLNVKAATEQITRFYKNYTPPIDWDNQDLSLILLVKIKTGK